MTRREIRAKVTGGEIVGWVDDPSDGPEVLMLHGGPGLSFDYLDGVADELLPAYNVASFQQRGLAPSTTEGPFDITTQLDDVRRVLDELGWSKPFVLGHSWGGHFAMHIAVAMGDRLSGVLVVDPLGAVGDGGEAVFEAEMMARTPDDVRQRAQELDERAMRGEGSEEDMIVSLGLMWPAYFADPRSAPPMPPIRGSAAAYAETFDSLHEQLPALESALPTVSIPVGFLHGGGSPMPITASTDSAGRIPGAWVEVVDSAGHFPWFEQPGCVRAALDRLSS